MAKNHGPSIKNDDAYESMREDGYSKSKAARIANAMANENMSPTEKGGHAAPYEEWTKHSLYERAQELDVGGRSSMSKDELITALREA
jgi:hypothetical protein